MYVQVCRVVFVMLFLCAANGCASSRNEWSRQHLTVGDTCQFRFGFLSEDHLCVDTAVRMHCHESLPQDQPDPCQELELPQALKEELIPRETWYIQEIGEGTTPQILELKDVYATSRGVSGKVAIFWEINRDALTPPLYPLPVGLESDPGYLCYPKSFESKGLTFHLLFAGTPASEPYCVRNQVADASAERVASGQADESSINDLVLQCVALPAREGSDAHVRLQVTKAGESVPFRRAFGKVVDSLHLSDCNPSGCGSVSQFQVWWITASDGDPWLLVRSEESSLYQLNTAVGQFVPYLSDYWSE